MKSLSDYIKILRSTATNLNLHGESVEMVVQMLANALYISEVEHVAYSQEASLERASQENSKIQHCVNQMYSVYRGANPRVIINFTASKLFTFKPHQEIIKSNNFTVYYLGYFNETTGTMVYSDLTIYPDTPAIIIGLLGKEVVSRTWTVGSENPYYYTLPESDLSGDLYLDIDGTRTDTTRIFSDHLREDLPFDMTLPGYGLRLYYPESLQGNSNTRYSLSVYRRMSIYDIQDSERKALKMTGSTIQSFDPEILKKLDAEESYPGIIFIPETPHDALDTIHYKVNKNRYSGSYLSTNSDLSWLLQEYYPSKIRRLGVTYKFESPKSTALETLFSSKALTMREGLFLGFKDVKDSVKDWVFKDLEYLPEGELTFSYWRSKEPTGSNSSYEIIPSVSVIPVRASGGNYLLPTISDLSFRVIKNTEGYVKLLTTSQELKDEGLKLTYLFPTTGKKGESLKISTFYLNSTSDQPLEVVLEKEGKIVDQESIPFAYTPVTIKKVEDSDLTFTEEGPGEFYTLDLQDDTLYIRTTDTGEVTEPSETIAILFYNGRPIEGVSYSLLPSSDLEASVDPKTGVITISKMSEEVLSASLIVKAKYGGMNFQALLVCRKTISNFDQSEGEASFSIISEESPIITLQGSKEIQEVKIEIPRNRYKGLSLRTKGISFKDARYTYSWEVLKNIIPEDTKTTPTLHLYYIPYSSSNPLDKEEISKFIETNKSYYITQDIKISEGQPVVARFNISLGVYRNTNFDGTVLEILQRYSYLFDQDFGDNDNQTETYFEIKSLITKISEVKNVEEMKITYLNPTTRVEKDYQKEVKGSEIPVYYIVECVISSIVKE